MIIKCSFQTAFCLAPSSSSPSHRECLGKLQRQLSSVGNEVLHCTWPVWHCFPEISLLNSDFGCLATPRLSYALQRLLGRPRSLKIQRPALCGACKRVSGPKVEVLAQLKLNSPKTNSNHVSPSHYVQLVFMQNVFRWVVSCRMRNAGIFGYAGITSTVSLGHAC